MNKPIVQGLWAGERSPFSVLKRVAAAASLLAVLSMVSLAGCSSWKPLSTTSRTEATVDTTEAEPVRHYNSRAIQHYMEGVNAQMQGNHAMAALEFQEALRYDSTSSTIYTDLARSYIRLQKFDRAEEYLRNGLRRTGEPGELLPLLGQVYLATDHLDSAKSVYTQILADPEDADQEYEALSRLAEINAQQKNYLEVARIYERIFRNDPDRLQHIQKAKEIYLRLGRQQDARRVYRLLRKEFPEREEFQIELAKLYAETGSADSAIAILQPMLSDSTSREVALMLGELYFKTGALDSAYSVLTTVDRADTANVRLLYYLGGTTLNLGERAAEAENEDLATRYFREAERYYHRLIRTNKSVMGGYYGLGIVHRNQENYAEAARVFARGMKKFPQEHQLPEQLGITYYFMEEYDSARVYLNRTLAMDSSLVRPKHFLAFTYDHLDKPDSAEVMYKHLLQEAPDEPLYLNNLAYLYAVQGKHLDEALSLVNNALKKAPENSSYLDTKGWVYYQLGEYDKARRFLERALEASGENAEVLEHLGDVYTRLGQPDKARVYYQRALDEDPENEVLQEKVR